MEVLSMAREKKKRTPTFTVLLIMNFMPSVCQGVVITQTPKLLLKMPGSSAEMKCHQNDESYIDMFCYTMLWYQQKPGEGLVLIAMSLSEDDANPEKDFKETWTMTRPSNANSTLKRNGTILHIKVSSIDGEKMRSSSILLILFIFPSICQGVVVTQTPKLQLVKAGELTKIECHQNDATYFNMFWYQQKPGEGLKLMILSTEEGEKQNMEQDFKSDWELERKDIHNSVLRLKSATTEDSAVYFWVKCIMEMESGQSSQSRTVGLIYKKGCRLVLLFCSVGLSHAVTVTQNKDFILLTAGSSMEEMSCTHDATGSYTMLWYQQKPGEGLVLIAMSLSEDDANPEKDFKETWTMTRPSNANSTLKRNGTILHIKVSSIAGEKMRSSSILLILFIFPSICQGVVVTQTPKLQLVKAGELTKIECHQNDATYFNMFWYQQKPGEGLKLMILSTVEGEKQNMEPDWELERKDIHNSVLRLKSATTEDSAVRYLIGWLVLTYQRSQEKPLPSPDVRAA
ncbi:T cell receptor beta variable 12-5 [Pelobates cultripes]|nr:T cell receptor beta variable 12-5 [Pelobates cultripes]